MILDVQAELLGTALPGVDAPQVDSEAARDGDNGFLACRAGGPRSLGQQMPSCLHGWILRLEAYQAPGALHQRRSQPGIAVLGDMALVPLASTAVLSRTQAGVAADFAAVVEALPVAHLVGEDRGG